MLTQDHFDAAYPHTHGDDRIRVWAAAQLRAASRLLDRLAIRLSRQPARPWTERHIEFHGEAGAPEGALYVDGQLVGHLPGVTRL
jgi:hypothetical protein